MLHRVNRVPPACAVWMIGGCTLAALVALSASTTGDYSLHAAVSGDNAAPGLDDLAHGQLSAFIAQQPLMGLTSIVLRLPVAGFAAAAHTGQLTTYRVGALACLLPAGLLAGWIVHRASSTTKGLVAGILAAGVVVAGPATSQAIIFGHPEEVLASALAAGSVLAASARRPRLAAVLLGLAIGTKQWALFAAPPVLLAAGRERTKIAVLAGGVALLLAATVPLADPAAFARAKAAVFAGHLTNPLSVWWPFGSRLPAPVAGAAVPTAHRLPLGLTRSSASAVALAPGARWNCRRRSESAPAVGAAGPTGAAGAPRPVAVRC